jgi:hypothetical protein
MEVFYSTRHILLKEVVYSRREVYLYMEVVHRRSYLDVSTK